MANQGFWEAGLEGTVDRMNAALLQYDTAANRPAAGQTGRLFYATDTSELSRDNGSTWDTLTSGGLIPEGSNTTEATTTSTSAVDLITVGSLSITAAVPIMFVCSFRKTTGAAALVAAGLKLNSTVVSEAILTVRSMFISDATDAASSGGLKAYLGPRVTNYLRAGTRMQGGNITNNGAEPWDVQTADMPTATITSLIIRGIVANASVTLGADDLHVYSLATS